MAHNNVEFVPFFLQRNVAFATRTLCPGAVGVRNVIPLKVFFKSFCKSQPPPKSVNLSFTITAIKNESTNLCANQLVHDNFKNTLFEIKWAHFFGCLSS